MTNSPFPPVSPEPSPAAPGETGAQTVGEAMAAGAGAGAAATPARAVYDVPLDVQIVLGHAEMTVDSVMKLGRGAVVEIERRVGDAVDVCINNHLVARGEVVLVDGEKLGVALTEVVGGVAH